jgi:DNA-binding Lrp family transcriptional regulator
MSDLVAQQRMTGTDSAKLVAQESRKLRNRLSQKAYRARQCMRIKELEERLDSRPLSENSRVRELEQQNVVLRDHLLTCHKKLESLQVTLRAISDSTANAVGMEVSQFVSDNRKYPKMRANLRTDWVQQMQHPEEQPCK